MLKISDVCKSFGEHSVLENVNLELHQDGPSHGIYCLMAPSGAGKTTLFRIILGLEKPDSGYVSADLRGQGSTGTGEHGSTHTGEHKSADTGEHGSTHTGEHKSADTGEHPFSVVFQEDRLCEDFSPVQNIRLACRRVRTEDEIREEAGRLLPAECLDDPVKTLSGGMKRRVAILRAVLAPSGAILMDEPFTGLDEETRRAVTDYILEKRSGRLLLTATHHEDEAALLGAEILHLPGY